MPATQTIDRTAALPERGQSAGRQRGTLTPRRVGRATQRKPRQGVAAVEVAICLPVLFTLTLATMDLCSLFFLKESVTIAAYEGARQGIDRGQTDADVRERVQEFLDERSIAYGGSVVTISSPGFDSADTLEHVTVTVTVPCRNNLLAPDGLYGELSVSASVTMRKEFQNDDK